jgi:hypothetical protein
LGKEVAKATKWKKIEEDVLPGCGPQRSKGFMAFYPRRLSSFIGGYF